MKSRQFVSIWNQDYLVLQIASDNQNILVILFKNDLEMAHGKSEWIYVDADPDHLILRRILKSSVLSTRI